MKATMRTILRIAGMGGCVALIAGLSGCGGGVSASPAGGSGDAAPIGSVLLSVNPEIEIAYDAQGDVVSVAGANEDGALVLADYDDAVGRPATTVAGELVGEIDDDGYFENGIGGRERNIVLKIADGSDVPSAHFMDDMATSVQHAASDRGLGSSAYALGEDDLDDAGLIGIDAAKQLVLGQLGLDPSGVTFHEHDYELDDGVYELEFMTNGIEYDFEVDARTGKVLEADFERNDDWDDRDSWDDGNSGYDDGATDYGATNYDDAADDGVSDYGDDDVPAAAPAPVVAAASTAAPAPASSSSHDSGYDDGNSGYDDGNSGYDDGDDGNSDYDD